MMRTRFGGSLPRRFTTDDQRLIGISHHSSDAHFLWRCIPAHASPVRSANGLPLLPSRFATRSRLMLRHDHSRTKQVHFTVLSRRVHLESRGRRVVKTLTRHLLPVQETSSAELVVVALRFAPSLATGTRPGRALVNPPDRVQHIRPRQITRLCFDDEKHFTQRSSGFIPSLADSKDCCSIVLRN